MNCVSQKNRLEPGTYITDEYAERLYQGIKEKNFNNWSKINGHYYIPLGACWGVRKERNKTCFIDQRRKKMLLVARFEFVTLDDKQYFLRVIMQNKKEPDVFIPIV